MWRGRVVFIFLVRLRFVSFFSREVCMAVKPEDVAADMAAKTDVELLNALQRFYDAQDELKAAQKALRAAERARVEGSQRRLPGVR